MAGSKRLGARELIEAVVDPGSWASWDAPALPVAEPGSTYAAELAEAAEQAGTDESVITGEGRIKGRRVALVAGEFRFLAGSIGRAAAERIVLAFERARREELPLFAAPSSGGTRMQEGTPAFLGMVKISAAVAQLKSAGIPYIVYLRHPTTGGVFASWGSLGHVTAAEPGAMIGFLGTRVYSALYGRPFPDGVQTAENLHACGLVDAIVPVERLAELADRTLNVLDARHTDHEPIGRPDEPHEDPYAGLEPPESAWDSIVLSRRLDRPGVKTLLKLGASDVLLLRGTGQGEHDPGMLLALARFGGTPALVLGQDRHAQTLEEPLGPGGLRVARRGIRLAADLDLPLVSIIDTEGAALSKEAEEGGLAGEIARSIADLVMLPAPTLCVLLGQGTGGGALAILPADRVICAQHAWLSPLPPEGASAIVHRTIDRAHELAESQRVRSTDLKADGIVDRIVPEHPDAAEEPEAFCQRMAEAIHTELDELWRAGPHERLEARLARYRALGM
ncbi:MAG: acetyl-CoA carboxyl transferase [Actinomycetales bacterium]|nr:MAG: acetyl-CoA carboxyl transferase [Actinomycetales bacterium]